MSAAVVLSGWREGEHKISAARLLQAAFGFSLAEAHGTVDRVLEGESVVVTPRGDRAALIAGFLEHGFVAHAP